VLRNLTIKKWDSMNDLAWDAFFRQWREIKLAQHDNRIIITLHQGGGGGE
jgi:hypothetical protein